MRNNRKDSGAIMLEGMIVTVITLFVLVWILGLGFLYYQRYVTTIITNDAATKIAATYDNPASDIIMGYIAREDFANHIIYRNLYENAGKENVRAINEDRAASYVKYILNKANFSGTVKDVSVKLVLKRDSLTRQHVELTTTCTFNTPFGEGLELFGLNGITTYQVTSYADCSDIREYMNVLDYSEAWIDGRFFGDAKIISSVVKLINKIAEAVIKFSD